MLESQSSKWFFHGPSTTSHTSAIFDARCRTKWRGEAIFTPETSWPFWTKSPRGICSTTGVTWEITQVIWEDGSSNIPKQQPEMDDVQESQLEPTNLYQLYPLLNLCLFICTLERPYFKMSKKRPSGRNVTKFSQYTLLQYILLNLHISLVPSLNPAFAVHAPNLPDF